MSKNLEKEYKDLYEQEVSNIDMDALWNKIEAALPEKEIVATEVRSQKTIAKDEKQEPVEFKPVIKWYRNTRITATLGTLAACAVVLLVVAAGFNGSKSFKSDQAASNIGGGSAEMSEMAATESKSESAADTVMNEAACEESVYDETKPVIDESESCVSNESVYTEFEVLSENEDYYLCVIVTDNDVLKAETEIYLTKGELLEVGIRYADDLVFAGEEGEIKIFEIY